jgi:hypothetical protein
VFVMLDRFAKTTKRPAAVRAEVEA